jgi:endonuclease YncB( thermonuclease family)
MTIWTVPARVTRVIDGDTLVADLDQGWGTWKMGARVRLEGLNAPEIREIEGRLAKQFVEDVLLDSREITVVSRSLDKYGRTLAVVRLADGRILNDLLMDAGHAEPA